MKERSGISRRLISILYLIASFTVASGQAAVSDHLQVEVIDPNPALLSPEGEIIAADSVEAIDRLGGDHPFRVGAAADGVSPLLLRVRTSNAVTFSVSPRFGTLRDLSEGAVENSSLTVMPRTGSEGTSWAFALYTPPDDLQGAAVRRTFAISARADGRSGSASLRLINPPVLLVHGLWSDYSTWSGLADFLKRRGFYVCEESGCTVNYGPVQPAPSFDPLAEGSENQFAIDHLISATTNTLKELRQEGIAATQVDVVAHSLGGLIARSRVALPDPGRAYRRRENFQRGDFHKLITIGTPHRGTPVADFLLANREARSFLFGGATLEEFLTARGYPFGPAVEQMQTFSAALVNLGNNTNVPAHAIVSVAPANSPTERLLNSLPGALGLFFTVDDLLGGNGRHDTLVSDGSQAGGLSQAAISRLRGAVHTDIEERDVGETDSRAIWLRVAQLLRASPRSTRFGNFTALETNAAVASVEPR